MSEISTMKPIYEWNGQYTEDAVLVLLLNQLGVAIERMKYLEIGTNDPKYGNQSYALYQLGARGVLVDPLIEQFRSRLVSLRPEDTTVAAAITGTAERPTVKFYVAPEKTTRSSLDKDKALTGGDVRTIEVPLLGINELLAQIGFVPDLLVVDAEGADESILRTLDYNVFAPTVIMAETGQSRLAQYVEFMESKGYTWYCTICRVNSIFFRGKLSIAK